jgi:hypothetical protein
MARMAADPTQDLFKKPRPGQAAAGAGEDSIRAAEAALSVSLPTELRLALQVQNGGALTRNLIKLKKKPPASFASQPYRLRELPGVAPTSTDDIVELTELARIEWGLPDGLVPLTGDGHWWCCLDYRSGGEPRVVHVEPPETEDDAGLEVLVAESFGALLKGLTRDPESSRPALIALNDGAPTGPALDQAMLSIGFNKAPEVGWSNPNFPMPPRWQWDRYDSFVNGCKAQVEVWRNQWTPKSPLLAEGFGHKHPMLRVYVAPAHEEAALGELLRALGPGAVLVHNVE